MSEERPRSARVPRRRLDGVLLLDKEPGVSSNHALQAARRLFRAEKAGHTGTLDPLATGLLPLCFGEATKFSGELLDADKRYVATVRLGVTTSTADAEGEVLECRPVACGRAEIDAVLKSFLGEIEQVPPMYSALKRDGRPLYEYARAGIELERAARRVRIHELALCVSDSPDDAGCFTFEVSCSKGTYVRTLAADIGARLGCGAHLAALRRTGIGRLGVGEAYTLTSLEALETGIRDATLLPPDALLAGLAEACLDPGEAERFCHGQAVCRPAEEGVRLRIYGPGRRFIGLGQQGPDGYLRPLRLVATREQTN